MRLEMWQPPQEEEALLAPFLEAREVLEITETFGQEDLAVVAVALTLQALEAQEVLEAHKVVEAAVEELVQVLLLVLAAMAAMVLFVSLPTSKEKQCLNNFY